MGALITVTLVVTGGLGVGTTGWEGGEEAGLFSMGEPSGLEQAPEE